MCNEVTRTSEDGAKIDDLKLPVAQLHALLQDPQYRMLTWWGFLHEKSLLVYNLLGDGLRAAGKLPV